MLSFVCSLTLIAATDARSNDVWFHAPVLLRADSAPIDVGADIGHAGPQARDIDGDGDLDLLVSNLRGTIHVYENIGTREGARFERRADLRTAVGDAALKFENW